MTLKSDTLEKIVMDRVNGYYLVPRKSSEVLDGNNQMPVTLRPEVRESAARILKVNGIDVPEPILTRFVNRERFDLKDVDEVTGWNIYWAQEMAAAQAVIAGRGGSYDSYLPGRFMHYDLLANIISNLFNNGGKGLNGKEVLEAGSGSGLGLILLATRGAVVHGIDTSKIGNAFAQYLAGHFAERYHNDLIRQRVGVGEGDYFRTEFGERAFDVVYNSGVAEHLSEKDLDTLIVEMVRVTKPGGYVLITVPNEDGIFYGRYRQAKEELKKQFPALVNIPVDTRRHNFDIKSYMQNRGLVAIKEDGLQVAPSTPVRHGDIRSEHLPFFDMYLPTLAQGAQAPIPEARIAALSRLELMTDPTFRMRYGWSIYYVGRKPLDSKPAS